MALEYSGQDFENYLSSLINMKGFDSTAEGIAKQVLDKGIEALSDKQYHVFEKYVMKDNLVKSSDCMRCGNEITWDEMDYAIENGGFCSWCNRNH